MNAIRLTLAAGLLAAGGYGIHLHNVVPEAAPQGPATAIAVEDIDKEAEEKALRERFDLFRTLRIQDDIVALYDLADPEQRRQIDLPSFLSFYGHGMVSFKELTLDSIEFEWASREATVTAMTTAELLVDKLPKNYRMAQTDAADAQISAPNNIAWIQRGDGQWYFRMDQQIVNGSTGDGRGVTPF